VTRADRAAEGVRARAASAVQAPRRDALRALAAGGLAATAPHALAAAPPAGASRSTEWPDDAAFDGGPPGAAEPAVPVDWPPLRLLDGRTLAPESWRGLAAVLVVWSVNCPFCVRHNPRIEALHRAVAGRPLRVLGASIDADAELVRRHAREHGYTFPITLEAQALRARFGLRRVTPTTVTFDRAGRLLQRIPGEMAESDVMALARLADAR
jgi:thiol-disulfide isomerase/thioredoxin